METKPDKQQTVTRLALCVVVAVALYAAAGKVPPLEPAGGGRGRASGPGRGPLRRVRKNGGPAVREVLR